MKKQKTFLLPIILVFSLSCQFLFPAREGTIISACTDIVKALRDLQPGEIPQHLQDTGVKIGNEFNANDYFNALTQISMQEGFVLDYLYQSDFLGAFPMLYVRPEGQPGYASLKDIPPGTDLPDYHDHIVIEDVEQGYFEYVLMEIMAGQFYLYWHASYNDTRIVCNRDEADAIIADINAGDFGMEFDASQKARARTMKDIEPLVKMTTDAAMVELVTFTKWGGFYRRTYTISRSFPHTILNVEEENLVPYDCGIMF
ncbi:MAG TPA: hypothetical protein VFR47_08185 [Anaerolineales bacterium]|nr:hypothetical protein [Anaerolineales bacterium]